MEYINFKERNWMDVLIGGLYLLIFFTIDYLNMPYPQMAREEGLLVVLLQIALNLLMAFLAYRIYKLHENIIRYIGKEAKGGNTPIYSALFGLLTYGCTPCVISFFAMIGINFSIVALPWAGLPYKLVSLGILLIGYWFTLNQHKKTCKIN